MPCTSKDRALSIEDAHAWLAAHGFKHTLRQVKRMAWEKKAPFERALTGRELFIWESRLAAAVKLPDAHYEIA